MGVAAAGSGIPACGTIGAWMARDGEHGRTPITIVSVAHLDDDERALVLGVLLEEILSWVRSLPGSQRLRALIVFDEVFGFLPPHPANPPTKRLSHPRAAIPVVANPQKPAPTARPARVSMR